MCHSLLDDASVWSLLVDIDREIAATIQSQGCPCGETLHSARYPRKSRGWPSEQLGEDCQSRLSFCCDRDGCRRRSTQLANRFLMRGLGFKNRSMREDGVTPAIKRTAFRVANKIRLFPRRNRSSNYITNLQLHPDEPLGYKQLDEKIPALFSESRHAS